ncbi:hypothetical protein JCM8097_003151 [Rhodosporidiobolus ruineniae]
MAREEPGPCLACGKEAETRCQACGKAGISLFFCSKEHQRLLWPTHKKVCGARSNPFTLPGLTVAEVDDAVQHLHTSFRAAQDEYTTLAAQLDRIGMPRHLQSRFIGSLGENSTEPTNLPHPNKQISLFVVRSTAHGRGRDRRTTPGNKQMRSASDLLDALSWLAPGCYVWPYWNDGPFPSWWTRYQHLLLAALTMASAGEHAETKKEQEELFELTRGAHRRVRDFAETDVRADDPRIASAITDVLGKLLAPPARTQEEIIDELKTEYRERVEREWCSPASVFSRLSLFS